MAGKDRHAFLQDLNKRPADKPLSLNEFSSLREISYKEFKEEPAALELLIKYCKDRKLHPSLFFLIPF